MDQEVAVIRKGELKNTGKTMKNWKPVCPKDTPVEVRKHLGKVAVDFLIMVFNRILESEKIAE